MARVISWPLKVQQQLSQAYNYIFDDSPQNAENVKNDILASTRMLIDNPEMYPPDKYRKNNKGNFRAYELHHYRISYRVTKKAIIIVPIRHTRMEPKEH